MGKVIKLFAEEKRLLKSTNTPRTTQESGESMVARTRVLEMNSWKTSPAREKGASEE